MNLGELIKMTRQKSLCTQEEFANMLHVSLSTVNRWELNKTKPNIKAMKLIKCFCEERQLPFEMIEKAWLKNCEENKNAKNM